MKSDQTPNIGPPIRHWIPFFVLAVSVLLTIISAYYVAGSTRFREQLQFQSGVGQMHTRIHNRLDTYIAMLRSGGALFAAGGEVGRESFHRFVQSLELETRFPGIQGYGFTQRVSPAGRDSLEQAMRAAGIDTFHIWPDSSREEYHAIIYLEPLDRRNRMAIGYDMATSSIRRAAMERARDSGRAAASGVVQLVQEIDSQKQSGFLIYYPVYRGGGIPASVAERRQRLLGYVYAPFRASDLLRGVLDTNLGLGIEFEVFEDAGMRPEDLLYASPGLRGEKGEDARFVAVRPLSVAGRPWSIRYSLQPGFHLAAPGWLATYIMIGGLVISLVLFGLARAQARARDAAERNAHDLRRSEERYRTIIETAPDVIYSLSQEGNIISLSPAFEKISGWKSERWVGEHFAGIVHPEDLPAAIEEFLRILAGETPTPFELRILTASGSYVVAEFHTRPYLDNGEIVGSIGIARDTTARRETERTLRDSEERYRAFVSNSSEAIWRCELDHPIPIDAPVDEQLEAIFRDAYLGECNDVMAQMYGFERADEIAGTRLNQLMIPSDPENIAYLRAFITSGYRLSDAESVELDRDGREKHFSNNLVGIIEDGCLVRAWGTQRDITARRETEQQMLKAREAAEAASRAKDQFLAVLSHELRTPLTPVLTAMQILNDESQLPADVRSLLDVISRNVELEARLIDDLLDLTKITNGKLRLAREVADVHEVLNAALDISRADIAKKELTLRVELSASRHHVLADPARLQQIFWNLITNAVKFTPQGGAILVRSFNERGMFHVEVADSGIGIDPEQLPHIFNAFEQGEKTITRRFGGLGLGLTISKMLTEMHGGTIAARSGGEGTGSAFTVGLETVDPPVAGSVQQEPEIAQGEHQERRHILLVDDHADTIMVLRTLLERQGYRVSTAYSVHSALETAAGMAFDLLISDIGLPDGTGLDIIRELRKGGEVKGIALSGFGMEEDIRRSLDAGFLEHIAKPVNFKVLHESVRRILDGESGQ